MALPSLIPAAASAQTPPELRSLVGARAGQAEGALQAQGYSFVKTDKGGDSAWSYWKRGDTCVQVTTTDGRYASIDTMDRKLCGGSSSSNDKTAAVIAGVAVLGLAAALAAHNNKHNDRDGSHDSDYSHGYQDALYGSPYASTDSEGYHNGYLAGEAERSNRRASNTPLVRGAPAAAQSACARRGDEFLNVPPGSTVPVSVIDYGRGDYEVTVASGYYRARCNVNAQGYVSRIDPYY